MASFATLQDNGERKKLGRRNWSRENGRVSMGDILCDVLWLSNFTDCMWENMGNTIVTESSTGPHAICTQVKKKMLNGKEVKER